MPPFITWPTSGAPMGPGFSFRVGTDTPGVPIVGTFWRIKLEGEGGTAPLFGEWRFPTQGLPTLEYYLSSDAFALGSDLIADPRYPQGATIRMQVAITSEGSVVESIEQPVKIDYTSGAPRIITEKQATATGGFTSDDRLALQDIRVASVWDIFGHALDGLPDLIEVFVPGVLTCIPHTVLLEGEGEAHRGSVPTEISALGFRWTLVSKADGIGIDEGNPDQVEITHVQFAVTKLDRDGQEYVVQEYFERGVTGSHLWRIADRIYRLRYYVQPGVQLELCWLTIF